MACEVVWAEVSSGFGDGLEAMNLLSDLGVAFSALDADDSVAAGATFRSYRQAGGSRERMVADFLIGAHARNHADRLLTRDRGFFRRWYDELTILDPAES